MIYINTLPGSSGNLMLYLDVIDYYKHVNILAI